MQALRFLIILILSAIATQDFRSRSVNVFFFPLLALLLVFEKITDAGVPGIEWRTIVVNLIFLFFQLLVLTVYFSARKKTLVSLTSDLLGWGDVLLLLCCALYFSVLNFVFFYIASLFFSILVWVIFRMFKKQQAGHVPLAGLQGIAFILFLSDSWFLHKMALTSDDWILNLVTWSR